MHIRLLDSKDARDYRRIRLEALQFHPAAFGSSFEEEKEYSFETIAQRLSSDFAFTFGAFKDDKLIGVVTLVFEQKIKLRHRATIVAMYVVPE